MTQSTLFPITTIGQAKAVMLHLQTLLTDKNEDVRTLKHSKLLHRFAEAVEMGNWHRFVAEINRATFMATLQNDYGLSETYADAAALSSQFDSDTLDPVAMAHAYAERYNISAPSKAPLPGQDPKQLARAEEALTDLLQGEEPTEFYGEGYMIELTLIISSGTCLHLSFERNSDTPTKGMIRCTGFGTVGERTLSANELYNVCRRYEAEIQATLDAAMEG